MDPIDSYVHIPDTYKLTDYYIHLLEYSLEYWLKVIARQSRTLGKNPLKPDTEIIAEMRWVLDEVAMLQERIRKISENKEIIPK
jgi:hypothetical protein